MRAKLEGSCLENEKSGDKANVSKGQARELGANERATEKVALPSLVAAERIEDHCRCLGDLRGYLEAIGAIGPHGKKNAAAYHNEE